MPAVQNQPHRPRTDTGESPRLILGQFLKFIGLVASAGGSLAVIRLIGTREQGSVFYALFMPAGIAIWVVGFLLSSKAGRSDTDAR